MQKIKKMVPTAKAAKGPMPSQSFPKPGMKPAKLIPAQKLKRAPMKSVPKRVLPKKISPIRRKFELPARPWGEAEIAHLIRNADSLSEEVRAELGIVPVVPDENFQADFDAAHVVVEEAPVVEEVVVEEAPVVEEVIVEEAPVVDNSDAEIA